MNRPDFDQMLTVTGVAAHDRAPAVTLTLPFELREKSRLRARLDDGREVALLLPHGNVLRDGDRLVADNGMVIEVRAAREEVSTARAEDPCCLMRACYHLGNRHVALQIGEGWLRYRRDHVLDDLLLAMGLQVGEEQVPFEPEAGAYNGHDAHAHRPASAAADISASPGPALWDD